MGDDVDFESLAVEHLRVLMASIEGLRVEGVADIAAPVMQLKANASVYDYVLIRTLANMMLGFLDDVEGVDDDVLVIARAYHDVFEVIVLNKMVGEGGSLGEKMRDELQGACDRYFAKRA